MSNTQKTTAPKSAKKPQDRKPPREVVADLKAEATEPKPFTFTHDGQTYTLPPASEALLELDGGELMDAIESEDGEVRLGIRLLRLSDVDPETLTALRSKKIVDFSQTLMSWLRTAQVAPGE